MRHFLNNFVNGENWSKRTKYNQGMHEHNFKRWLKPSGCLTQWSLTSPLSPSPRLNCHCLSVLLALVFSYALLSNSAHQTNQNTIHQQSEGSNTHLRSSWAVGLTQGKLQEPAGTTYHFGSGKLFSWLNHVMKYYEVLRLP